MSVTFLSQMYLNSFVFTATVLFKTFFISFLDDCNSLLNLHFGFNLTCHPPWIATRVFFLKGKSDHVSYSLNVFNTWKCTLKFNLLQPFWTCLLLLTALNHMLQRWANTCNLSSLYPCSFISLPLNKFRCPFFLIVISSFMLGHTPV